MQSPVDRLVCTKQFEGKNIVLLVSVDDLIVKASDIVLFSEINNASRKISYEGPG